MRPALVLTVGLLALAGPALAQERLQVTGAQPAAPAPAASFTGAVAVQPLFAARVPSRVSGGSVTFQPGARSHWHTHPVGQTLIVTAGSGYVQSWGEPARPIRPGDVVTIPPGVKHWHGAGPATPLTHIAIQEAEGGRNVDWLEPVTDQQYRASTAAPQP